MTPPVTSPGPSRRSVCAQATVATADADSLSETTLVAAAVDAALAYFRKHQTTMVEDPESMLPAHLRHCVIYVHDNLSADLSVPKLLQRTHVFERTLYKLFKTYLHKSPRAYVEAVRLRHARRLLLGGKPVSLSAQASGLRIWGGSRRAMKRPAAKDLRPHGQSIV